MPRRKPKKQRRTVGVSISAPVFVTLTVERDITDLDDPGEWNVVSIQRIDCELSARTATECMDDVDLAELDRLANAAEDDA